MQCVLIHQLIIIHGKDNVIRLSLIFQILTCVNFSDNLFSVLPLSKSTIIWAIPLRGTFKHHDCLAERIPTVGARYKRRYLHW